VSRVATVFIQLHLQHTSLRDTYQRASADTVASLQHCTCKQPYRSAELEHVLLDVIVDNLACA
jgi:hypothetical protein